MNKTRRIWAYIYMPILYLVISYGVLYFVLAPIRNIVTSSVSLILLNEAPTFNDQSTSIFDEETANQNTDVTKVIPSSEMHYPSIGEEYGQLIIEKASVKSKLFFGDRPVDLRTGVGQFNGSVMPGEKGTTLIGGHNTTDLALLYLVEAGDELKIQTHYGNYLYKITSKRVASFDDPTAIESVFGEREVDRVILYTCNPPDMIGLTDERLFVYGDLVSGPFIDPDN